MTTSGSPVDGAWFDNRMSAVARTSPGDIGVVSGGATGVGVAVDAAARTSAAVSR